MSKLGDIMGDEFADKYENNRQAAEERRRKVSQETMMEICYEAINNGGFEGDEPRFRFDDEEVTHDVALMESPQSQMEKFIHELGQSGGMSMGMFHLGDLWSCVFNDDMVEMVDKIEEDEYYVVVGRYTENIENAGTENEEKYINISPTRGIVPIEVAKDYADKYEAALSGTDANSQAEQQNDSTSTSDSDDSGSTEENVLQVFEAVGNKKPEVLEDTSNGNEDAMEALTTVVNNNLSEDVGRETILDVFEDNVEDIDGRGEEEDDGGLDISADDIMGGSSSDSEDDDSDDSADESPDDDPVEATADTGSSSTSEDTSSSDDDDGGSSVDSWF
jgi:hypothetical protein